MNKDVEGLEHPILKSKMKKFRLDVVSNSHLMAEISCIIRLSEILEVIVNMATPGKGNVLRFQNTLMTELD